MNLCDGKCKECFLTLHPNSRVITKVMNEAYDKYGEDFYMLVTKYCPNLTVCFDCREDDFCHFEDCELSGEEER